MLNMSRLLKIDTHVTFKVKLVSVLKASILNTCQYTSIPVGISFFVKKQDGK